MIVTANCKINIGLDILRRRADGYHDLETLMYPVRSLYDTLEIVPNDTAHSRLETRGLQIDCPADDNICIRACEIMRERFGTGGVDITLHKRIPFGAGLGGGSSDGVAVLKAINELFGLNLSTDMLIELDAALGSDTSFFVRNEPQICTGRREIVTPAEVNLDGLTIVLAKPDEGVSTREAYAGVTPSIPTLRLGDAVRRPVAEWQGVVKNDFERSVFAAHPRIGELKQSFLQQGAIYASMSGSGSSVFGLFDREIDFSAPFAGIFIHSERL